jgi:putative component of membrane protein insertase Oxa1/YidC/SpoIIIJ protein YidD
MDLEINFSWMMQMCRACYLCLIRLVRCECTSTAGRDKDPKRRKLTFHDQAGEGMGSPRGAKVI